MRLLNNEKEQKDKMYEEVAYIKEDPESYVNQKLESARQKLSEREVELSELQKVLQEKEDEIRYISVAHMQFKEQLEGVREELLFNQSEKEVLSRKLTLIEAGDSKKALVQNENLKEQNQKLLQAMMKLLNTSDKVNKTSSKKTVKRYFSNSMKNSTVLLSQARRLSSPSPSKKRKSSSKRKIKRRKFSSGTRKAKYFKRGRNMQPNETSPFPIMFQQLTPLISHAGDKNLQMFTQKFRTDKQDLHDARTKINSMQKFISNLKIDNTRARDKYRKLRKMLTLANTDFIDFYEEAKDLLGKITQLSMKYEQKAEGVNSFEELRELQNVFTESCVKEIKVYKKQFKTRLIEFKHALDDSHIKLRRDEGHKQVKEILNRTVNPSLLINESYGSHVVQSKEFSGEDGQHSENNDLISLKMRLLDEDQDRDIEVMQPRDESLIGDHSVFENRKKGSRHEEVEISEDQLRML